MAALVWVVSVPVTSVASPVSGLWVVVAWWSPSSTSAGAAQVSCNESSGVVSSTAGWGRLGITPLSGVPVAAIAGGVSQPIH